jgi:hypothetical protein
LTTLQTTPMPMLHRRSLTSLLALAVAVFLIGCSGPPQTSTGGEDDRRRGDGRERGEDPAQMPEPRASVADYETFDPSGYPVSPPKRESEVSHRVPDRLLAGRADEGVRQTLEGFRIQVYSAQDKQASEEFREEVRQWWQKAQKEAPDDLFSANPPIVIEYAQPYYRVRFGAFAEREAAEQALEFVRSNYPDAFMARSTVTVMR